MLVRHSSACSVTHKKTSLAEDNFRKEIVQFHCWSRYRARLVFPYCYPFSIGELAKTAFSSAGACRSFGTARSRTRHVVRIGLKPGQTLAHFHWSGISYIHSLCFPIHKIITSGHADLIVHLFLQIETFSFVLAISTSLGYPNDGIH
jgi:hypothetical protein